MSPPTDITQQPDYTQSAVKAEVRQANIQKYVEIAGRKSLPLDRGYWTLCNRQPDDPRSEIMQIVNSGLAKKFQFHGVDRNELLIAENRVAHPEAYWYAEEWLDVIRRPEFNPALIYLDMTSFAGHRVSTSLVAETMLRCPPETVIFANVMLNDPRSSRRFDPFKLIANLSGRISPLELEQWNWGDGIDNYEYATTHQTDMMTYVLHKSAD